MPYSAGHPDKESKITVWGFGKAGWLVTKTGVKYVPPSKAHAEKLVQWRQLVMKP